MKIKKTLKKISKYVVSYVKNNIFAVQLGKTK